MESTVPSHSTSTLDYVTQSWAQAARLVRCTGFGATGAEVDAASRLSRADYVSALFTDTDGSLPAMPRFEPLPTLGPHPTKAAITARDHQRDTDNLQLVKWWLTCMTSARRPFRERLTFAWHGIFATSVDKVGLASLMAGQNSAMRAHGAGAFRALALSMLTDPAMILWLDNETNTKSAPNENLAREFMELFALGHGNGYTEDDVREGARALSGWVVDVVTARASVDPRRHDDGIKTVLGVTGDLDLVGYCDAVLSQPASAAFVVGRLWNQLVSDQALDDATRSSATAAYGLKRDLGAALRAMFTSSGFDRAAGTRVLTPVEWGVGLARAVEAPGGEPTTSTLVTILQTLGQLPFHPPSVGGWPGGQAWLSSSAITGRWDAALRIIALGQVDAVGSAAASARLDAAGHLLGVATWSDRSATALQPFVSRPEHLVAAASMTPEYLTV